MSRKISHIVQPLKLFVQSPKFGCKLPIGEHFHLPPLLEVARLKGEALAIQSFFTFLTEQYVQDPQWSLDLYQQIVRSGKPLLDLSQRIGVFAHFSGPLAATPEASAYIAWCILLDALHTQQHPSFEHATTGFYRHYFLGMFPKKPAEKADDLATLKQQLKKQILRHFGADATFKESFVVNDHQVHFTLKLKRQQMSWVDAWQETGERLKPTRMLAYKNLLHALEQGTLASLTQTNLPPVASRKHKTLYLPD